MSDTITHETSMSIACAHAEIKAARKLLTEINAAKDEHREPDLSDAFGRRSRSLQLGVPSGGNGHKLFDVDFELARYVIDAHVAKMEAKIGELCAVARMELDGVKK